MKAKLNEEESKLYMVVVTHGNMDDMFDFAYTLGQKHEIEKELKKLEAKINTAETPQLET